MIFRLTHTDLKPENILFTSSDWEISYNARKRKDVRKVKSTEVVILNKKIKKKNLRKAPKTISGASD